MQGNIFGEGFPKEIVEQVELRQKAHGLGWNQDNSLYPRNDASILYTNANSSWCKLVSSAEVYNYTLLNNSNIASIFPKNGDDLAKKFVLFNGTSDYKNPNNRSGFNTTSSAYADHAYTGWGNPTADFGYRPMAGIQSIKVKHKNRGSIRMANVNIKAWDKTSFEIVDLLYLRLGFSILLEWGHSIYYDNKSGFLKNNNISLADEFIDAKYSYNKFLDIIDDKRIESYGNYDAMFGKVTNFHWTFNKDGSYDIILDLVSIGDVIESFKAKGNTLIPSGSTSNTGATTTDIDLEETTSTYTVLEAYAETSDIAEYLFNIAKILGPSFVNFNINGVTYKNVRTIPFTQNPALLCDAIKVVNSKDAINQEVNYDTFFYLRLGNLLEFIQDGLMYKVKDNKGNKKSLLFFDTGVNVNLMHAPDQLMSYDPNVCMVRRSVSFPSDGSTTPIPDREYFTLAKNPDDGLGTFNTNAEQFMYDRSKLDEVGKIMNIYVNFRFILSVLENLTDKDTNEIKLIDFLRDILSGINGAMGGYPKLDLFIDETTNKVKIIDENPLPSKKSALRAVGASTNYALFELYGYAGREDLTQTPVNGIYPLKPYRTSTFIRDFKFDTELTPEFSTMISVAATSNGSAVGENNTALSKLNLGVKDKYKIAVDGGGAELSSNKPDPVDAALENFTTAAGEYFRFASRFNVYLEHLYKAVFLKQEIEDNKGAYTIYLKLYKKYMAAKQVYESCDTTNKVVKNVTQFQPGTGFIPFNLSITMDGLSGMKIGSKFIVDGSYLPSNYPNTVDFLIKNMVHEVKDNMWTTTLESYCISQGADSYVPNRPAPPPPPPSPPPSPPGSPPSPPAAGCPSDKAAPYVKSTAYITVGSKTGFCVSKKLLYGGPYTKTQIYLHHTAGPPRDDGGYQTIDGWNGIAKTPADKIGAPYVLAGSGHIEQLYDDRYRFLTQGSWVKKLGLNTTGKDPNEIGVGIEICNVGQVSKSGTNWVNWKGVNLNNYSELRYGWKGSPNPLGLGNGVSKTVDWNGNPMKVIKQNLQYPAYRGSYEYGQEYFPAQIKSLEKWTKDMLNKHSISWTWKGKATWLDMWPQDKAGHITSGANNSKPGIYTHWAVHKEKVDSLPLEEIVAMLKRI